MIISARPVAALASALALVAACSSHSTPDATPKPTEAYGIVLLAQLAPGTVVDGKAAQDFALMPGVGVAGGTATTFRVVVRAKATVGEYLAARKALDALPGVTSIATSTSLGASLDGRR